MGGLRGGRRAAAQRATGSATRRSSRATQTRRWRAPTSSSRAGSSTDPVQGVPIEPRAIIAQWQGDRVTVWSSTQVPYAARAGVAHVLQIPESHVRVIVPLARRRLRRQVRLPLRGPRRRARPRRRTPREARLLPPRGVLRGRPPPRGHGDRARDRRAQGRHARRAPRPARPRQGRLLRRGRLLRADGGDARARPLRDRDRQPRVVPQLLDQPALVVDPRPDRAAGLLGARAAHGRARRGARHGSRSTCAGARSSRRARRPRRGRSSSTSR